MTRTLVQRPEAPWRSFIAGFLRCGLPLFAVLLIKTLMAIRPNLLVQDLLIMGAISLTGGVLGGVLFAMPALIRMMAYKHLGGR